jgi:hypothetical protein
MYDPAIGRWHVMDPALEEYNDLTPYCYVANMPLIAVDPDGKRISIIGSKEYEKQVIWELALLASKSDKGNELVMDAIMSKRTLVIAEGKDEVMSFAKNEIKKGGADHEVLLFDAFNSGGYLSEANGHNGQKLAKNAQTTLAHEFSHFLSPLKGELTDKNGYGLFAADEVNAVENENIVRKQLNMDVRTHYDGVRVYGKGISKYTYTKHGTTYEGYKLVNKSNYGSYKNSYSNAQKSTTVLNLISGKRIPYNNEYYRGLHKLRVDLKNPATKTQYIIYWKHKKPL